jgi:threonine dehydratase
LRTPLRTSSWLSGVTGCEVLLKLETLQPTFSYKVRGALNAVLRLTEESGGDRPALVTASAGNHGRALAYAARAAGMPLTVYAPEQAPRTKLDAIRACGADLRLCPDYDEAERRAKHHGGNALYVSPYAHPDVIAGAGTVGLEILEDRPDVGRIVVPVGGGGLVSGIAISAHDAGVPVTGVEVDASCPFTQSLRAGRIVEIHVKPTLADGLAGNLDPDTPTFSIVQRLVDRVVVVAESDLRAAMAGIASEEHLIAEGAGAAGVAAVLARCIDSADKPIAVVLSGANVDPQVLKDIL